MSTATKSKISDIVKEACEIAMRSNEPMSLDEIRGKFQVEFPFRVKKVAHAGGYGMVLPIGSIVDVTEYGIADDTGHYRIVIEGGENRRTPANFRQWALV